MAQQRRSSAASAGQPVPAPATPTQEAGRVEIERMFAEGSMTNGDIWERLLPDRANYDGTSFRASPQLPRDGDEVKPIQVTAAPRSSSAAPAVRAPAPAAGVTRRLWSHRDLQSRADVNLAEAQCSYYGSRYY